MSCDVRQVLALPPLKVTRGASKAWLFSVYRRVGTTKVPVDLVGSKVWFTIKNRIEDVAAVVAKRSATVGGVANQISFLFPAKFTVFLDPADTNALDPAASYWCDAWVELPGGPPIDRQQVMRNRQLIIEPAVTSTF